MSIEESPMNDWKELAYTEYTFSEQFEKDMEALERARKNPACKGCMYQRYVFTEKGQMWYCRHPDSDGVRHRGDDLYLICPYKTKKV